MALNLINWPCFNAVQYWRDRDCLELKKLASLSKSPALSGCLGLLPSLSDIHPSCKSFRIKERKNFPNFRAGWQSNQVRHNQVLGVGALVYQEIVPSCPMKPKCWVATEATLKLRLSCKRQLLGSTVWIWEWRILNLSCRRKTLDQAISRMRPSYSKWSSYSSTDFRRFRIKLNLCRVWTVCRKLSDRVSADCSINKRSSRYPTKG